MLRLGEKKKKRKKKKRAAKACPALGAARCAGSSHVDSVTEPRRRHSVEHDAHTIATIGFLSRSDDGTVRANVVRRMWSSPGWWTQRHVRAPRVWQVVGARDAA